MSRAPSFIETWTGVARKLTKVAKAGSALYLPTDWVRTVAYMDAEGNRWVMWDIDGLRVSLRPPTVEEVREIEEELKKRKRNGDDPDKE